MKNKLIRTESGYILKKVETEFGYSYELIAKRSRETGPVFIEGNKVYVSPDAMIEYHYTKDNSTTALRLVGSDTIIGVEGSRYDFILKKIHGRMHKVYKLATVLIRELGSTHEVSVEFDLIFVKAGRLYVLPGVYLEPVCTIRTVEIDATEITGYELGMHVTIKGSLDDYTTEEVRGCTYRVYELI